MVLARLQQRFEFAVGWSNILERTGFGRQLADQHARTALRGLLTPIDRNVMGRKTRRLVWQTHL